MVYKLGARKERGDIEIRHGVVLQKNQEPLNRLTVCLLLGLWSWILLCPIRVMGDPFSILLVNLLTQDVQMVLQSLMVLSRNQFRFLRVTSAFYPITSLHSFETSYSSFSSFPCSLSSMFCLSVTCWVFTSHSGCQEGSVTLPEDPRLESMTTFAQQQKKSMSLGRNVWETGLCLVRECLFKCCLFGRIWSLTIRAGFSNVGGWGPWKTQN